MGLIQPRTSTYGAVKKSFLQPFHSHAQNDLIQAVGTSPSPMMSAANPIILTYRIKY